MQSLYRSAAFSFFIVGTLGIGSLITGCAKPAVDEAASADSAAETTAAVFNATGAPTIEIEVPSIHCEGCAAGVCSVLKEQPGVVDAEVDATTKVAKVAVDKDAFNADKAIEALDEAKFPEATVKAEDNSTESEDAA